MPFLIKGHDRTTKGLVETFSNAPTEALARKSAEALGIDIDALIPAERKEEAQQTGKLKQEEQDQLIATMAPTAQAVHGSKFTSTIGNALSVYDGEFLDLGGLFSWRFFFKTLVVTFVLLCIFLVIGGIRNGDLAETFWIPFAAIPGLALFIRVGSLLFYEVPVAVFTKRFDARSDFATRKEGLILLGTGIPVLALGLVIMLLNFFYASAKVGGWRIFLYSPYLLFGGFACCTQGVSALIFRSRRIGMLFVVYLILVLLTFLCFWTQRHS